MTRLRLSLNDDAQPVKGDLYGLRESDVDTFSSGCLVLDLSLCGGWALNRILNAVGDRSTGKSLGAIEACANFYRKFKGDCDIHYRDIEEALDRLYAFRMGLPKCTDFGPGSPERMLNAKPKFDRKGQIIPPPTFETVEDLHEDLEKLLKRKNKRPLFYVVDSLDALSDRDEKSKKLDEATYGTAKSKALSKMFRVVNTQLRKANITIMVISQVRDNIGVMWGDKHKRSGGKSLDFYATQIVWLAHTEQIKKVRSGVTRVVGSFVKAKCKKNKIGPAFRECSFPIIYNYGIEDLHASIAWLVENKRIELMGMSAKEANSIISKLDRMDAEDYKALRRKANKVVRRAWNDIEDDFQPTRSKYA